MIKAYPKNAEEIISFLNHLKKNLNNLSGERTIPMATLKKLLDNSMTFIEKTLIESEYTNPQTLNILTRSSDEIKSI